MFRAGFMGISALTAKDLKDLSLFAVSLPTLFTTFIYLAYNFSGFALKKFKTKFGILFIFFVLLCVSIPIGYGTSIYDIPLYRVRGIESRESLKVFEMSTTSEFNVFYLMGHTSGREIFFDATTFPASPIIIDRELIKTVKVSDDHNKPMTLRGLMEEAGVVEPHGEVSRSAISEEDRKWQEYVK
jgi:hypothetical protein